MQSYIYPFIYAYLSVDRSIHINTSVGNFLNFHRNTHGALVRAFSIESVLKIRDVKSNDGRTVAILKSRFVTVFTMLNNHRAKFENFDFQLLHFVVYVLARDAPQHLSSLFSLVCVSEFVFVSEFVTVSVSVSVCFRMSVYVCSCTFVGMLVCLYEGLHVRVHVCIFVCIFACMLLCMFVCMFLCNGACLHVTMYACRPVCMFDVCMVGVHANIHLHARVYARQ